MNTSSTIDNTLQEYCNFRNSFNTLMTTEPERAELNLGILDHCLWLNRKMQEKNSMNMRRRHHMEQAQHWFLIILTTVCALLLAICLFLYL